MPLKMLLSQSIAKDQQIHWKHNEYPMMFTAPIDLQPADQLAIETSDGQLCAVFRPDEGVIWHDPKIQNPIIVGGVFDGNPYVVIKEVFGE